MSYFPNPAIGGLAEMTEYENAVLTGFDQTNTYHPVVDAAVSGSTLDGWTYLGSASGTYTTVANAGGGQITFGGATGHGMVAGQVVFITSSSVAGYQPPNPTIFIIQSVTANTFTVIGTFTTTATGNWSRGCSLTAGAGAAGQYLLFWSVTVTPAGNNKNFKFEPVQNATNVDKCSAGSILTTTGPQCMSNQCCLPIAAGDILTLAGNNQTDSNDFTLVNMNFQLKRYER